MVNHIGWISFHSTSLLFPQFSRLVQLVLETSFFDSRGNRLIYVTKERYSGVVYFTLVGYAILWVRSLNPACDQSVTFSYNSDTLSRTQVKQKI